MDGALGLSEELLNYRWSSHRLNKPVVIETIHHSIVQSGITLTLEPIMLYLVIDEAVTNAMEHGNNWDPLQMIHVRISRSGESLNITIEDQGDGFDPSGPAMKSDPFGERGRGIRILCNLCDPIWNDRGNSITLRLPCAANGE